MTEREKIIHRLQKVKLLADQGTAGEREAAENLLDKLLMQYGISEDELEQTEEKTFFVRYKTEYERKLLHQLAYMRFGVGHSHGCVGAQSNRSRKKVGITCSPADFVELEADYEFFKDALSSELGACLEAFIYKNNLYPPDELQQPEKDREPLDAARAAKIVAMAHGIDFIQRAPQIEAAKTKAAPAATGTARK